ncbi:DUF2255 family protein [Nocardia sp. NPDC059180]|uniref:DUF2255 family protein n=1 Tax=Nocardia sp. NPDC059180 TaxID=3346761 RepID=UPI0036B0D0F4
MTAGAGRVRAGGVERDDTFTRLEPDSSAHPGIDAAYHTEYDRYGRQIVGEHATEVTLRLDPHTS